MSAVTKDIFKDMRDNLDPVVQEFLSRGTKENIVDLYVEYYNRDVDLEYQKACDAKERANLRLIINQCEQMIIQKALQENGYDARMMIKYVKKRG